jgi:ABC-2 type transport system ATP-binding protein
VNDALVISGVRKSYGRHQALAGIDLTVPTGSVFGVLGPNGAGKTTLFSVVAGFVRPNAGEISVLGLPHRHPDVLRGRLGILPQDAAFQSDISILDQLVYFLRLAGRGTDQARREVSDALDRVGLGDWLARRSTELSHGMYKRLCLAQAFLGDPEVVLLDEPTAGLDPANAELVRGLIRDQARRRAAVVVSSHDMAEMQALCTHVAILKLGRVLSCGPMGQVTRATALARLLPARPLDEATRTALAAIPGVTGVNPGERGWIEISHAADPGVLAIEAQRRCLAAGIAIARWEDGATLERHYQDVTAG